MRPYFGYLQDTLHGRLKCKCAGNCILKSLHVDRVEEGKAELTAEPYDDAYSLLHPDETVDKIERVLNRRKKAIFKALGVDAFSVTVYDEYSNRAAFYASKRQGEVERVKG